MEQHGQRVQAAQDTSDNVLELNEVPLDQIRCIATLIRLKICLCLALCCRGCPIIFLQQVDEHAGQEKQREAEDALEHEDSHAVFPDVKEDLVEAVEQDQHHVDQDLEEDQDGRH